MREHSWIAVDWGTSNVRLWLMSPDGEPLAERSSSRGMSSLTAEEYESVLIDLLGPEMGSIDHATPVIVCGMAGARQGWREAPYAQVPVKLAELIRSGVKPAIFNPLFSATILSGVSQTGQLPDDVMRGEETQLLGLLALQPDFESIVCMPGTHSKWVELRDATIVRFATAMTGELYNVIGTHSVLRHSVDANQTGPDTEQGVSDGMDAGLAHPDRLTSMLFRARSASLLSNKGKDWCSGYLSGLLVGAEVASYGDWVSPKPIALLGAPRLCRLYGSALSRFGRQSFTVDPAKATLAGLTQAYRAITA